MNDIFYQDDDEKYYYCMDFETHDLTSPGDSLVGVPIVRSEVRGGSQFDLVMRSVSSSGLYVCMWISGGSAFKTYKIEVEARTGNGVKLEGDGFLRIGD